MRNLLTVLAALVIVVAAGATYYFVTRDTSSVGTSQPQSSSLPTAPSQPAPTGQPEIGPDEHVLGKAEAPVTIIEYASMTCPHCANFHEQVLPRIKSEYIDKGLVRLVFRPFPLDQVAARAALLAQCVPADSFFSMTDVLFRSQKQWRSAADPIAALKQIGRTAGLSDADADRCMKDDAAFNRMVDGLKDAQSQFGVNSTPSFVVNGKTYTNRPMEDFKAEDGTTQPGFDKIIKDLLPKT